MKLKTFDLDFDPDLDIWHLTLNFWPLTFDLDLELWPQMRLAEKWRKIGPGVTLTSRDLDLWPRRWPWTTSFRLQPELWKSVHKCIFGEFLKFFPIYGMIEWQVSVLQRSKGHNCVIEFVNFVNLWFLFEWWHMHPPSLSLSLSLSLSPSLYSLIHSLILSLTNSLHHFFFCQRSTPSFIGKATRNEITGKRNARPPIHILHYTLFPKTCCLVIYSVTWPFCHVIMASRNSCHVMCHLSCHVTYYCHMCCMSWVTLCHMTPEKKETIYVNIHSYHPSRSLPPPHWLLLEFID